MKRRILCSLAHVLLISASVAAPLSAQAAPLAPVSAYRERNTAAFRAVIRLHAAEIAKLPQPSEAGIWLLQDATGNLISSGVLRTFPTSISNEDYGKIVRPGAGRRVIEFGLARTPEVGDAGPFRVAFVTVAVRHRRRDGAR